ncbi:MAG TPA: amidohydrolase family protein [Alphaproteobacteria bacterium]|nr:amidohydrolase family protein [Alphaproteobacteria bacterium]
MPTVDSDAHVIESMTTWSYLREGEERFLPIITEQVSGAELHNRDGRLQREFWVINGRVHNRDRNLGSNTTVDSREMREVEARLEHMDALGVDVQVIFPTLMLRPIADNAPLEYALGRSYNRWLADIWRRGEGRLRWAVVPPLLDQTKMRDELAFGKDNGACAVFMRPLECEKPLSDEYFFPLYELASEFDLPICVHLGNGSFPVHDFYQRDTTFTKFKLVTVGCFHSLVLAGTPDRFPDLRWGIIEAGSDWLPFVLNDLRQRMLRMGRRLAEDVLADNNIYVTCEVADDLPHVIAAAGEDNLVMGTDYGHSDFSSHIDQLSRLRQSDGVSAAVIDKILWDNPRALYGLD